MLLNLRNVFLSDGQKEEFEYSLDLHSLEFNNNYPFKTPVKITGVAENKAGLVKLILNVSLIYNAPCDRCFTDTSKKYEFVFNHFLVTSLESEDDDGEYIETPDYELEVDELVTSDILLELPYKFLCKEDCKGICSICGADLNKGDCNCNKSRIDPRLEALKQLLD